MGEDLVPKGTRVHLFGFGYQHLMPNGILPLAGLSLTGQNNHQLNQQLVVSEVEP